MTNQEAFEKLTSLKNTLSSKSYARVCMLLKIFTEDVEFMFPVSNGIFVSWYGTPKTSVTVSD